MSEMLGVSLKLTVPHAEHDSNSGTGANNIKVETRYKRLVDYTLNHLIFTPKMC